MPMSLQARRIRNVMLCAAVIIVAGVATYMIKSAAQEKRRHLDRLHAAIAAERDSITVLEADWQYLTRPDRIRELSGAMLAFTPPRPGNILILDHLDAPAPAPAPDSAGTAGLYRITAQ